VSFRLCKDALLDPAPLVGRGNPHPYAVFGHRAAGNVDALVTKQFGDVLVRECAVRGFAVDQGADTMADGFRRIRAVSVRCRDRRGEEIFELKETPRRGDVFIVGNPADCALAFTDRIGDVA
jgi:hypothetical protein